MEPGASTTNASRARAPGASTAQAEQRRDARCATAAEAPCPQARPLGSLPSSTRSSSVPTDVRPDRKAGDPARRCSTHRRFGLGRRGVLPRQKAGDRARRLRPQTASCPRTQKVKGCLVPRVQQQEAFRDCVELGVKRCLVPRVQQPARARRRRQPGVKRCLVPRVQQRALQHEPALVRVKRCLVPRVQQRGPVPVS